MFPKLSLISLPSARKSRIGNFLPDFGQELPGGLPESTFRGKIDHFLPDPAQELPGGLPESVDAAAQDSPRLPFMWPVACVVRGGPHPPPSRSPPPNHVSSAASNNGVVRAPRGAVPQPGWLDLFNT